MSFDKLSCKKYFMYRRIKESFRNLNFRKILRVVLVLLSVFILANVFFVFLVLAGSFGKLPRADELARIVNPVASEVYSADSVLMGKYYIQNRQDLRPDEVTPILENALLATEDIRFYRHNGIDFKSLGRVLVKSILLGQRNYGGGSTITQQLAKNLFPRVKHRFLALPANKIKEMIIARRLEKLYTKKEILQLYLNTIPFGENTYGIKSASLLYFNKNPRSLKTEEAATLIGMLKATNLYDPRINYDQALSRRNLVLNQMVKYGFLPSAEKDSLILRPIDLDYTPMSNYEGIAPYFREYIRKELEEIISGINKDDKSIYNLYTDGLKIYTTLDSHLQEYADSSVNAQMKYLQGIFDEQLKRYDPWKGAVSDKELRAIYLDGAETSQGPSNMDVFTWQGMQEKQLTTIDSLKHYLQFLQAGFLAMDIRTGEIKAWVGGINHRFFKYDHVTAKRQSGSTFKPVYYLAALEKGLSPCEFFANDSVVYDKYDNWTPRNADNSYGGFYSVKGALTHSVNTVSAKIFLRTGADTVREYAARAGITSYIPEGPSTALGTADISLIEMVNAYQAIANDGLFIKYNYIRSIEDRQGNILYKAPGAERRKVAEPGNAAIMVEMLRNVVNNGTAEGLRYRYNIYTDVAGKTGTTQNNTDGWFIGFTPDIVAGVWVGGELQNLHFRSMEYGQGAFSAMPVWAGFMKRAYSDNRWSYLQKETFSLDDSIKNELQCADFLEKEPFMFKPMKTLEKINIFRKIFRRKSREEADPENGQR